MTDEEHPYVEFTVRSGHTGKITDDLTVEYDGKSKTTIENAVSEVRPTHPDSDGWEPRRALLRDLIIDLPETTPITSIELHEG